MLTANDVAERLGVTGATVRALIAKGKLGCYRVGLGRGAIRVSEEHLAAFLGAAEKRPAEAAAAPLPRPRAKEYVPRKDHGFRS